MVSRNRLAEGVGLIAGVAALGIGGLAMGLELERRIINKRIDRSSESEIAEFFSVRAGGPQVTTADGVVLHTEVDTSLEDADPGEFTLLFVHGYALNMDCWHFQRTHFRGSVRQVFYDQRSHGRSSRSAADHCRLDQLAVDLEQILDEVVGAGPVIMIGHSMGGMAIMRLAQSRPELFGSRVVGVGLLHTSAGELAEHSPIRGLPGRAFSRMAEPLMASLNRIPELVERTRRAGSDLGYVVTRRMAFASDVPPSYVEFVSEMLAGTPLEVVADFYPAFDELDEYAALDGIGLVPTVVVGGEDDLFTPVAHMDRITELLPAAVSLRLPNCGHLGMIEHHEAVNKLLDDLLDRVRVNLAARRR